MFWHHILMCSYISVPFLLFKVTELHFFICLFHWWRLWGTEWLHRVGCILSFTQQLYRHCNICKTATVTLILELCNIFLKYKCIYLVDLDSIAYRKWSSKYNNLLICSPPNSSSIAWHFILLLPSPVQS